MPPISPDDWRRLAPLFDEILEVPAAGRDAWLTGRTDLSDADRDRLRELLAAHDEAGDRLETPLPRAAAGLVASSLTDPLLGETLGPFEVIEEIDRGGMGVVYRGRRTDGEFRQDVVIKVLRLGIDSDETRRRFLQERQILADLNHPAIVRLLDGGFTPDGRPYLVMNLVDGEPIDVYCDRERLDVTARVRLCLGVIDAVDHAHRHLVVHRDIKPSNVWVDRDGKVHLLDFGIAKMTDSDDRPGLTGDGRRILTPEYASPEQVSQEPVSTASDVYQLGLLIYQLVTGRYPYAVDGDKSADVERSIRENDPMPASRSVTRTTRSRALASATTGSPEEVSDRRRTTPQELRKVLRGDLEIILQKALRKEPDRRYHSARELRADLIRWLSGDRIHARPDSVTYQARRFVRRHPLGSAMMAVLAIAAVVFGTYHVQRIRAERDIARTEAERRKEVSDFLVDLLKIPDPTLAKGKEITARELIEVSLPRIEEGLSDPATKIRLLGVIGEVASNLGLLDQAGPAYHRRVELVQAESGRLSLESAGALLELAEIWRLARMYDDAIEPAESALAIRQELLPPGHVDIGRALRLVAVLHRDLGEHERAETELREATVILEAGLPADDQLLTVVRSDLAYVLRTVGKIDEAEAVYREILPVMRERHEEFDRALPSVLNNLAYLLRGKDEFAEAEALYREAIGLNESYYGEYHPSTLTFRNNLAAVLQKQGKDEATGEQLHIVVEMQEHLNGPDHWRTAGAHRALGYFLAQCGRFAEAEEHLHQATAGMTAALGPDHAWTAGARMVEAANLHLLGRDAEAEELRRMARPVLEGEKAMADRTVGHWLVTMGRAMTDDPDDPWRRELERLGAR